MGRILLALLGLSLAGCSLPLPSGINYEAVGRVVDAGDGRSVEGARVRIAGVRVGRPHPVVPLPRTCEDFRRADSLVAATPALVGRPSASTLSADTTAEGGWFSVSVRRRWVFSPRATDVYWPEESEWRRLEVEREGYVTFRSVVTAACPGSLVPPEVVELVPRS